MVETRFPVSRTLTSILAIIPLYLLVDGLIWNMNAGPVGRGCLVTVPIPTAYLVCVTLAAAGAPLSWIRPRRGYLVSGVGYAYFVFFGFFESLCRWHFMEEGPPMLVLYPLGMAVWLFYVGARDEPRGAARNTMRRLRKAAIEPGATLLILPESSERTRASE